VLAQPKLNTSKAEGDEEKLAAYVKKVEEQQDANFRILTQVAHRGPAYPRTSVHIKDGTRTLWEVLSQASATKVSCLSVISANPATIRICDFRPPEGRPFEFLAHAA